MINLILAWHNTLDMSLDSTFHIGIHEMNARNIATIYKIIFFVACIWRFYSQYECIYHNNNKKYTNFSSFFFRWPSGNSCKRVQRMRIYICEWWHWLKKISPTATGIITLHDQTDKTSKLINSETKVEHARKINIKKVAEKKMLLVRSYTFIFIYYVWNEY